MLETEPILGGGSVNRATGPIAKLAAGFLTMEAMRYLTSSEPPVAAMTGTKVRATAAGNRSGELTAVRNRDGYVIGSPRSPDYLAVPEIGGRVVEWLRRPRGGVLRGACRGGRGSACQRCRFRRCTG